jgi:transcriptional regulator with XRE-family HTH domain
VSRAPGTGEAPAEAAAPASFGARLRAQRERQQVSLDVIAEATKIRRPLLDALEHDDVSQWPGGLFRRSYLRAYATAIGLDAEQAVREFLACYPDQVEEPSTAAEAAAAEAARAGRRPGLLHTLLSRFQTNSRKDASQDLSILAPHAPHGDGDEGAAIVEEPQPSAGGATHPGEPTQPSLPGLPEQAIACGSEPPLDVDLPGMARLCRKIAQARSAADLQPLLADAVRLLHAAGLIIWLWKHDDGRLWPSLSHGYSPDILAQLPALRRDASNAIAAAFRTGATQIVDSGSTFSGAVVVPIATPEGCSGALAFECANGLERNEAIQALAGILAAQLSILTEAAPRAGAVARSAIA